MFAISGPLLAVADVRDRARQLLIQAAPGHEPVSSVMRPDAEMDLSSALTAAG